MDTQLYGQLILIKVQKTINWKRDNLFNKWCWKHWTAASRRMNLGHSYTPHKHKLRVDERPKCEARNHQNQGDFVTSATSGSCTRISKEKGNKSKSELYGLHQGRSCHTAVETLNIIKRPNKLEKIGMPVYLEHLSLAHEVLELWD